MCVTLGDDGQAKMTLSCHLRKNRGPGLIAKMDSRFRGNDRRSAGIKGKR